MKKFEITFEGKLYDYITQKMMLEYMNSFLKKYLEAQEFISLTVLIRQRFIWADLHG